jgi:hypothetical protein
MINKNIVQRFVMAMMTRHWMTEGPSLPRQLIMIDNANSITSGRLRLFPDVRP